MMRPVPIVMPELKQRKQEEKKAAASRKGDSVSRRCHRRILLGQGPCALAEELCEHGNTTSRQRPGHIRSKQLQKAGIVKRALLPGIRLEALCRHSGSNECKPWANSDNVETPSDHHRAVKSGQ